MLQVLWVIMGANQPDFATIKNIDYPLKTTKYELSNGRFETLLRFFKMFLGNVIS